MTPAKIDELCTAVRMVLDDMRTVRSVVEVMPPATMVANLDRGARLLAPMVGGAGPMHIRMPSDMEIRPTTRVLSDMLTRHIVPDAGPMPPPSWDPFDIKSMMTKALMEGLTDRGSTFGTEYMATFLDPVLEARPKPQALPAPAAKPVSSEAISESWGQELARRQAVQGQTDRPAGQDL